MKIYKRPWHAGITSMLWGLGGAAFLGVALFWLRTGGIRLYRTFSIGPWDYPEWVPFVAGGAVAAFAIWMAVISERIRFELDGPVFRYYQSGNLKGEYNLRNYYVGYSQRTSGGDLDSQMLYLEPVGGGEKIEIDAAPIGQSRFLTMFADLERYAKSDEQVIHVGGVDPTAQKA